MTQTTTSVQWVIMKGPWPQYIKYDFLGRYDETPEDVRASLHEEHDSLASFSTQHAAEAWLRAFVSRDASRSRRDYHIKKGTLIVKVDVES
jgi:hypothetical protein